MQQAAEKNLQSEVRPLTDEEIRRSTYTAIGMGLLLPPGLGTTIMALIGYYPFPEIYLIFLSFPFLYIVCWAAVSFYFIAPRAIRFVLKLSVMDKTQACALAGGVFSRLPWLMLALVTFYTIGGVLSADLYFELNGYRKYSWSDHLNSQFGMIPVVLITTFPIFFYYIDKLGRYLGPRGIVVTAIPMWVKVMMLGLVTPLLIDTMLIGYYLNRTGYFEWQTLGFWASLMLIAMGGSWMAWRSLHQAIMPLESFIESGNSGIKDGEPARLASLSLDEMGLLTERLSEVLEAREGLVRKLGAQAQIIDQIQGVVISTDMNECITSWNRGAENRLGYRAEEVIGKHVSLIYAPGQSESMEDKISRPLMEKGNVTVELKSRCKNGEVIDMRVTLTVMKDDRGNPLGVASYGQDIGDELHAKQVLLESEERTRLAMASANQGLFDLNLETGEAIVSAEYASMLGYDPAEFRETNEAWRQRMHPDDQDNVYRVFREYVSGKIQDYRVEFRQRTKSGDWKWILSVGKIVARDAQGQPLRMLGTHTDITERKHAEQMLRVNEARLRQFNEELEKRVDYRTAELRESEKRLREAQKVGHIGHWSWDVASNTVSWSEETFRLFGYRAGEVLPTFALYEKHIHPDDLEMMRRFTQNVMGGGQVSGIDYRLNSADGVMRWLHGEASMFLDGASGKGTMTGTLQDITERKQAELAMIKARDLAEAASRAKSDFLSRMSHELRTPMNAILGFSQVLETESLQPELLGYVNEIHRAGTHLLDLINELLDLSRIESGKLVINIQPFELSTVLLQAIQFVHVQMVERQIRLINHCEEQIHVMGDSFRVKQILVNLLSNAIKYNRSSGLITVTAKYVDNGRVRLSVADTGAGIDADKLPQLFMPFERLGAEKSEVDGTGIGLALSKQLAELMGMTMGVETHKGQGSTFWFEATVAQPQNFKPHIDVNHKADAAIDHSVATVLYIEDNPANLRFIEAALRKRSDISLLTATNGEFGLELIRSYKPAAILLDIHLPGMDGFEVLKRIKSDPKISRIPVIALSADAMPIDIEKGLKAGFDHYLTKPIKIELLLETLGKSLEVHQSRLRQ